MDYAITVLKDTLKDTLEGSRETEAMFRGFGNSEAASEIRAKTEDLELALASLTAARDGHLKQPETFTEKIAAAINHHSLEAGSDTPDFILAEYLLRCLENFDQTMQHRATWFEPSDGVVTPIETPSQQYRILEVGEVLRDTDEFNYSSGWEASEEGGYTVGQSSVGRYRRPL